MKKILLYKRTDFYGAKYIISKKKEVFYEISNLNTNNKIKRLYFSKNNIYHRPCNLGPQYKTKNRAYYRENNKFHNFYGYATINKISNCKLYYINDIHYEENKFLNYLSLYNNLSYKRIY